MSAFISVIAPEAALLLTDGATYDDSGIVRKIGSKVYRSSSVPFAVTTRGHAAIGERLALQLCSLADELGAAAMIDQLQKFADVMCAEVGDYLSGDNIVQVVAIAYLPDRGAVHRAFTTEQHIAGHDMPAWHVYEPPSVFAAGPYTDSSDMREAGVRYKLPDECMTDYVRAVGADLMEVMRNRLDGGGAVADMTFHSIGGLCDLTVVNADGAKTETLRVWDDLIGERVNPSQHRRAA